MQPRKRATRYRARHEFPHQPPARGAGGPWLGQARPRARATAARFPLRLARQRADALLTVVIPAAIQLSVEQDFDRLLERILLGAKALCRADGGTLYLRTPDDCLQQIGELQRLTGLDHLVTEFGFGGMPHEDAELNMRLFADRVMPALQRDRAFAVAPEPATAAPVPGGAEGIFAPA